jgi:hypothetical protein
MDSGRPLAMSVEERLEDDEEDLEDLDDLEELEWRDEVYSSSKRAEPRRCASSATSSSS